MNLFVGAMTGTSLDGIEAALIGFERDAQGLERGLPRVLAHQHDAYPAQLRDEVLSISQGQLFTMQQLGSVHIQVARCYVQAVQALLRQAQVSTEQIIAVGAHGQTVHHQPIDPLGRSGAAAVRFTLQLGEPHTMAVALGVPVVADFRNRDMALGGQGAPLACSFHDIVFRSADTTRVVLNLGGIANVTVLHPGQDAIGYDTGPANILLDQWIMQCQGLAYDANGDWAARGAVINALLRTMLDEPYFRQGLPKSTGRELFNAAWLRRHLQAYAAAKAQDVQRTLLELTAQTVANQVLAQGPAGEVLVCGGGSRNSLLLDRLASLCKNWRVRSTDSVGIAADAVEAAAFAVFAQRTFRGQAVSVPSVTGASRSCILGNVFPP